MDTAAPGSRIDVFYDFEHRRFALYLGATLCDCHELLWQDADLRSDDDQLLSCPLTPIQGE